jgi:hypothetical protein
MEAYLLRILFIQIIKKWFLFKNNDYFFSLRQKTSMLLRNCSTIFNQAFGLKNPRNLGVFFPFLKNIVLSYTFF